MNVVELIKEKLDKYITETYYEAVKGIRDAGIRNNAYHNAISIVDEVAKTYKSKAWLEVYDKVLQLEKRYDAEQNTEAVNDCIKLQNLLNYFKQELYEDDNNGWIPCNSGYFSTSEVLVCKEDGTIDFDVFDFMEEDWKFNSKHHKNKVIAWQPLPAPYKEGGSDDGK